MDIKALKFKVDEVKALFILAQRVIPFMEELFSFIEETSPLLDEINNAIKDNLKKMPNASKQLSKVTQATEMASTEIMDTVDRVNDGLYKVISELEEFKNNQEQLFSNPITLLEIIADGIANGKDLYPRLATIQQFIARSKDINNNEHTQIITDIINNVRNISDDANTIINSLQMQDITAQQLAAVNHLLENVQSRLSELIKNLNAEVSTNNVKFDETTQVSTLHRNIAFDPDAVDSITASNRQHDIDAMLANPELLISEEVENTNTESVDDIDALVSSFQTEETSAETTLTETVENEEFSQDDIDALFGNM